MSDPRRINELDETVARLKSGDPEAREQLLQQSWDRLHRLARKMLAGFPAVRRWEDTDDVFQRATVRLWESLGKVQPEDTRHFFNLAALQIRRELIDLARSLNGPLGINHNQESVEDREQLERHLSGQETSDGTRLSLWTDFHESIDRLAPEEREVVQLIWYQGFSQETVASMTGVSQKTVSRRWQKGRREIYELLDGQLPG